MPDYPKEVTDFLDQLIGRSPKTRKNYESLIKIFWEHVNKKPISKITVSDIIGFLHHGVNDLGWQYSTMRQYGIITLRLFGELRDEKFVKDLKKQIKNLPKSQAHSSLYEGIYVPPDKIDQFIEAADNEEWAVLYTMMLKWGLRIGEALRITPADIKDGKVVVRGKGFGGFGKIRHVLVEKSTIARVLWFSKSLKSSRKSDPIIKTIKERTAQYRVKQTAKKIKLSCWKKLTPHDLRHSYSIAFLTKRKKEGMAALVLLKNQLGHTSITTTQIYLDLAGGEAQDIFDAGIEDEDEENS